LCPTFGDEDKKLDDARSFVIPVLLFSLLYNVPKFFELKTERVTLNATRYQ
jgi:hypothetical protein